MAYEKENQLRLLNLIRGYLSPSDSIEALIAYAYFELKERNEITTVWQIDEGKQYIISDKTIEKHIKDEFRNLSTKDIKATLLPLIEIYSRYAGKMGFDNCPKDLCELAIRQLKIESGDIVCDLGSGYGYFLGSVFQHFKQECFLNGVEINPRTANISRMLLSSLGAESFSIDVGNGLEISDLHFNKAFTFPPIGLRMMELNRKEEKSSYGTKFSTRNTIEWIFVDRMLSQLKGHNKRAVSILAPRALLNEADQEYRDALLKDGKIESIIELPAGLLSGSTIKCCLVVFSENNRTVKIVDASNVLGPNPTRFMNQSLPLDKVEELIKNSKEIDVDELVGAHTLMPSALLVINQIAPVNGKPLNELSEVFTGCQYTVKNFEEMFSDNETGYRILTSSDINDGSVEWSKLQTIDYKDDKFDKYAIKKNDLVITSKSSKVKICVVDIEPMEKILVTGGMIIVRPDMKKLNPTYLKLYLDSTNGQLALKSIQRGSTIITINAKDLGNVVIPDASLEKQNIVAKKYNSKLSTLLALKEELKKIENSLSNLYSDEFEGE